MDEEHWAWLGEQERQENLLGELDSNPEAGVTYGEEKDHISDETMGSFAQKSFYKEIFQCKVKDKVKRMILSVTVPAPC